MIIKPIYDKLTANILNVIGHMNLMLIASIIYNRQDKGATCVQQQMNE